MGEAREKRRAALTTRKRKFSQSCERDPTTNTMVAAKVPYEKMIKAAIVALKDRTGSITPAIAKYMKANYDLPENFGKTLSRLLKKFVEDGKLVKVKASYKLGSLKAAPKKKKVVKKGVKPKKAPKKKVAPKKKKAAPKK